MDISQSFRAAQSRTNYLLWTNGSWSRWLKFGFLAAMAGATPNLRFQSPGDIPMDKPEVLAVVIVLILGIMAFSVVMGWFACLLRFAFVENIVYDRDSILEPAWRLKGLGTRVFGFYMSAFIAVFALAFGIAILFGGSAALIGPHMSEGTAAAALLGGIGLLLVVAIPLILVSSVVFAVTDDLVVPIMYRDNCGVIEGFSKLRGVVKEAGVKNFLLWFFSRMAVGAVWGIIYLMVVMVIGLLTALLVSACTVPVFMLGSLKATDGAGIALICVAGLGWLALTMPIWMLFASPGITFLKCFSIYALQAWDPTTQLLPSNGLGTVLEPVADPQIVGFGRPEVVVE